MNWLKWLLVILFAATILGLVTKHELSKTIYRGSSEEDSVLLVEDTVIQPTVDTNIIAYTNADNYFELMNNDVPIQSVFNVENNHYELRIRLSKGQSYRVRESGDSGVNFRFSAPVITRWDKVFITSTSWIVFVFSFIVIGLCVLFYYVITTD